MRRTGIGFRLLPLLPLTAAFFGALPATGSPPTRQRILFGGGGISSPASLPGCVQRWSADTGTYQDTGKTTPAVADGDPVAYWQNQQGSASSYQQATGTKRPVLKLSILGGRPVLRWDGVDDYLVRSGTTGITGERTFFLVITNATVGLTNIIAASGRSAANNGSWSIATDFRTYTGFDDSASGFNSVSWAASQPTASYILAIRQGKANTQFNVNNAAPITVARVVTQFTPCINELGATDNGNGSNAAVDIAELDGYARALSSGEVQSLTRYLGKKYGISVP